MEQTSTAYRSRAMRKWLRFLGWSGLWLATILCLGISALAAYSRHRYQAALARARDAGMPASWDEVLPKPLPEEDNFGALEEFKPFLAVKEIECPVEPATPFGTKITYLDEKGMDALKGIKALKISGATRGASGPFAASSLEDLRKKAVADKRLGEDSASLSDADAILKVFEDLDPLWKRLHAAKHRPHAALHIPLKPSASFANPLLTPLLSLSHIAQLKARAWLSSKRGGEAFEECLLLLRLADLRALPTLIEYLVRTTEISILMPAVYEGVSQHVWSDEQLEFLEKRLAGYDLLPELRRVMVLEILFAKEFRDFMNDEGRRFDPAALMLYGGNQTGVEKFLVTRFSKTAANVLCSATVETTLLYAELLSDPTQNNLRAVLRPMDLHWGPLNAFAGTLSPALAGVLKKAARTQSVINIARVAIALERYHLRQGSFPPALSELAPAFLSHVPLEVFDGEPLKYRLKDNAQGFTLFSTGWKGTDDGGEMNYSNPDETNWVWSSP